MFSTGFSLETFRYDRDGIRPGGKIRLGKVSALIGYRFVFNTLTDKDDCDLGIGYNRAGGVGYRAQNCSVDRLPKQEM